MPKQSSPILIGEGLFSLCEMPEQEHGADVGIQRHGYAESQNQGKQNSPARDKENDWTLNLNKKHGEGRMV